MLTLTIVLGALALFYYHFTQTFGYWKQRGVKHDRAWPVFGTNVRNFLFQMSMTGAATDAYLRYPDEKVVGFYRSSRPELIIRDPTIAKRILTTDFWYFNDRGFNLTKSYVEPMLKNLFNADGDLWRLLRQRLTPAFSSGKLKAMFPLIVERTERLKELVEYMVNEQGPKGATIDARELMARFTTDVIGACGFGIEAAALSEENSSFRKLGVTIFSLDVKRAAMVIFKLLMPELLKHWKFTAYMEKDILDIVSAILKQRNYEHSGRHDFIDLLLECKKQGTIVGDSIDLVEPDGSPVKVSIEMDDMLMAAQAFVFFAAGFETSSSATSFTLHQLAYNPKVQNAVHEEVDRVLAAHENKLSYDSISEMTYLKYCIQEALRMFPPLGFLQRQCTRRYVFQDLNFSVDPDVTVSIPVQAYQMDPRVFPEPEEFRPERFETAQFTPEQKLHYLPFGDGPRACVGERLGMMQSMAGLAAVLARFSVRPAAGAPRRPRINTISHVVQIVEGGLPLVFRRRD